MSEEKGPVLIGKAPSPAYAAEQRFRLLVESVKDYGIFLMDTAGNIDSWNDGAERITGYTDKDIIGKHFSIFYTLEDKQRKHPQHELVLATKNGTYEEEGWRVKKDGSRFWSNIVITALRDDVTHELIGFAKVTRDLSERRASEDRLRLNEERARKIFEGIKDYAIITLTPDGRVASWNEGARRIKGYEADEVIGKYFSLFYPEQDISMGKCEYELREAAETGRFEDEGWRIRKDGTKFYANVLITTIRGDHGEVLGFTKVTRDITDKKRSDDLLRMSYNSLEKRVEERTQELTRANAQLQEAIRVRDEFLSIASHELRTPLTPMKLQIQGLLSTIRRNKLASLTDDRLKRIADISDKSINRLTALIDNLIDISRINTGKLNLNFEEVDLTEMARELIERYRSDIQGSGSGLTVKSDESVTGQFDRLRVEQIFVNLLTNALKYGNGKSIEISLSQLDHEAKLVFKDHGIGIAPSDQKRIFERFEQVQGKTHVGGLGLGLYITRQIIEAHGGTITIESSSGQGSVFTVTLPLKHKKKS